MDIKNWMFLGAAMDASQRASDAEIEASKAKGRLAEERFRNIEEITNLNLERLKERYEGYATEAELKVENRKLLQAIQRMEEIIIERNKVINGFHEYMNNVSSEVQSLMDENISLIKENNELKKSGGGVSARDEKEVISDFFSDLTMLDVAEHSDKIVDELAEERALMHQWILSRNSYWEIAYRLAKETNPDVTMEDIKAMADQAKQDIISKGFTDESMNEDWLSVNIADKITLDGQRKEVWAEIELRKEAKGLLKEEVQVSKEEQAKIDEEIAKIDRELEELNKEYENVQKSMR